MGDKNDLKKKIYDWLNKQGYPLEMEVAKSFQKAGFHVSQSKYYMDPESGDSREVDVVASTGKSYFRRVVTIKFIVECKVSKDKPWVLFSSLEGGLPGRSNIVQRACSKLGLRILRKISDLEEIQNLPFFKQPSSIGYGATQAFTTGKDVCYSASMSVARAALASINKANEVEDDFRLILNFNRVSVFEIIFPLIVIDGRMFETMLSEKSDLIVNEIESGILLWGNPVVGRRFTIISIVNKKYLDTFCKHAKEAAEKILTICNKNFLNELIEEEKTSRLGKKDQ
jgi:hypothetical protein